MEKIIFLGLTIPILAFVLYLGATAIMKGFSAKNANKSNDKDDYNYQEKQNFIDEDDNLSDELSKLNKLYNDGVLTKEEFEKAKKKILDK